MKSKKKSVLKKKLKKVEKELSAVSSDIRSLSKGKRRRGSVGQPSPFGLPPSPSGLRRTSRRTSRRAGTGAEKQEGSAIHDERFADYFSGSFEAVRPLKHERKLQRNKALVMVIFVVVVLLWVLSRVLL